MKKEVHRGKFAFTSDDYDVYTICFEAGGSHSSEVARVTLNIKMGVEARSYDEVAKAEKLEPMELELRKLEDLTESIIQGFVHMKQREEVRGLPPTACRGCARSGCAGTLHCLSSHCLPGACTGTSRHERVDQ